LIKSGLLIREKYDDPVERKPRYGLRVDKPGRFPQQVHEEKIRPPNARGVEWP